MLLVVAACRSTSGEEAFFDDGSSGRKVGVHDETCVFKVGEQLGI